MSNPSTPFLWKGDARRAGGWPKAKKSEANLRRSAPPPSRGRREKRDENPSTPFPWKGVARRAGVGRRRKRAKPTSGATRHLLPEEGGRSGMSSPSPLPMEGGSPKGGGVAEVERERSQPPALRATSFQRKEGKVAKTYLPPSGGRRKTIISPVVEKEQNRSCHPIV